MASASPDDDTPGLRYILMLCFSPPACAPREIGESLNGSRLRSKGILVQDINEGHPLLEFLTENHRVPRTVIDMNAQ